MVIDNTIRATHQNNANEEVQYDNELLEWLVVEGGSCTQ